LFEPSLYVYKADFVSGQALDEMALEVLSETVVVALARAEHYDTTRSPMAWLLGIAINTVKQKRDQYYRDQREIPVSHIKLDPDNEMIGPADLFDRLAALDTHVFDALAVGDPEPSLAERQPLVAALARLSVMDREVLKLDLLHVLPGRARRYDLPREPDGAGGLMQKRYSQYSV
jgi:DNA-directed RNA polymerase specialized sigma24 family protein